VCSGEVLLGTVGLTSGTNELTFEIVGKDERSTGYMLGIDHLKVTAVSGKK